MEVLMPNTLDEALRMLVKNQDAIIVAGGTDLWPRIRDLEVRPERLLDISGLSSELSYIRRDGGKVRIGSMTTVSEIAESKELDGPLGVFKDVAAKFGSPQIRNVATIGGNICASLSSEDYITLLLALDASVVLKSVYGERVVRLEDFIVDKRVVNRKPYEVVTEVQFNDMSDGWRAGFEKVGRRNTLIINLVNVAVALRYNGKVEEARVALNRVNRKVPGRARAAEKALLGKEIRGDSDLEEAVEALRGELSLSSDFRASGEYRAALAEAYFKRIVKRLVGVA